ncbi:MAG: hypothetical protein QOI63_670 [Thermoplasmata archaeon]|jgi:hypothetical protein|nr:hypothetical protein [Thermoplasmata archaeon]
MRSLVVAAYLLVALAVLPATEAKPLPCDVDDCHVTILLPPGVRCPEAGHYDYTTVGPVTVGVLHCDPGVPP